MHKFTSNFSEINVYKKQSKNSEIVSQIIYGQNFEVLKKTKTLVFINCEVSNDKGLVISASGTWKIL